MASEGHVRMKEAPRNQSAAQAPARLALHSTKDAIMGGNRANASRAVCGCVVMTSALLSRGAAADSTEKESSAVSPTLTLSQLGSMW